MVEAYPAPAALTGFASESTIRTLAESVPRLLRHPVWERVDACRGRGQGVLLIPGFGFSDHSLSLTRTWLRARGFRAFGSHTGLNVACTTDLVHRLERSLERHVRATGKRVIVLGQSRGGWLGRIAALRRPDLVRGLVMLGSAVRDPLGAHPRVIRFARFLSRLSAAGIPGLLDEDCFTGPCYRTTAQALGSPIPDDIPALAVYSRTDGIAPWHLCQDPYAECVEVRSNHTGMALHPDVYTALEPRLAAWAGAGG